MASTFFNEIRNFREIFLLVSKYVDKFLKSVIRVFGKFIIKLTVNLIYFNRLYSFDILIEEFFVSQIISNLELIFECLFYKNSEKLV